MKATYHAGERAVQERVGVRGMAERVGRSIGSEILPAAANFLALQPFLVLANHDEAGNVWASPLVGTPGFAKAVNPTTVVLSVSPHTSDTLKKLWPEAQIGLLALEPVTRRRIRINGVVRKQNTQEVVVQVEQSYNNCPKYIQARTLKTLSTPLQSPSVMQSTALQPQQITWLRNADTFFIASSHPEGGADASHRGGRPGFIKVMENGNLEWPEYSGNMMYNTLGNIESTGRAGLLVVNFETGDFLQLTGSARVVWDKQRVAAHPGAELLVEYQPTHVLESRAALPLRSQFESYSPYNP
jgi:uncharacterized protein